MNDFVLLVEKKGLQRKTAVRLAERRVAESRTDRLASILKIALLGSPLVVGAFSASRGVLRMLLLIAWLAIVAGIAFVTWQECSYARKLLRKIREQPSE